MTRITSLARDGKKPIGRLLVEEGIVELDQLKHALETQQTDGGKIVETLVRLGYTDLSTVCSFLATRPGIASIELDKYKVSRDLCALIPREYAIEHEVFPIDRMGNSLTVAMAFPIDVATIHELEEMTELSVKALLCNADDIRAAIRNYYGPDEPETLEDADRAIVEQIESGMKLESVVVTVRRIDELPTLPQTVQQVQEATADPDTSLRDIADIVSTDPPISAKLLRLANSAAYGFLSRIDNVHNAITLLGMRETYLAVLCSAVLDLTEASKRFDHQRYWRSSVFCAAAARNIAVVCSHGRKAGIYTAGLLCDIGQFALSEAAPAAYAKIGADLAAHAIIEAEEQTLGIAHPEAGHILAVHWRLPDEIAEAIRFHHRPQLAPDHEEMVGMVALASIMTEAYLDDARPDEAIFEPYADLLAQLNLSATQAVEAYAAARSPELM